MLLIIRKHGEEAGICIPVTDAANFTPGDGVPRLGWARDHSGNFFALTRSFVEARFHSVLLIQRRHGEPVIRDLLYNE